MGTTAAPAATRPAARAAARSPAPAVLPAKSLAVAHATPRPCACGGRCPRCAAPRLSEPGDALEREADALADRAMPSAVPVEPAAPSDGPRPLPPALRHWLQEQLQTDVTPVRVHAHPAAARRAKALRAQAFTAGNEVFFAAGRYAPHTRAGLRLLAHEVAHVRQQRDGRPGALGVVQRAPDDADQAAFDESEAIGLVTSVDADASFVGPGVEPGATHADLSGTIVYDGDTVIVVFERGSERQPVEAASLPAEVEPLGARAKHGLMLHVRDGASARGELRMTLYVGPQRRPLAVTIVARPLPALPEVRDGGLELAASNRESVHRLGGHLRREHRALPPRERVARRRERAQERRELRQGRRTWRREERAAERERGCTLEQLQTANAALHRAASVVQAALARLEAGAEGPRVRNALRDVFNLSSSASAAKAAALAGRTQAVLSLVLTGLHLVRPEQLQCNGRGCDFESGAYVKSIERGADVTLCASYFRPGFSFRVARGPRDARAYALAHEFAHLAGVDVQLETRRGKKVRPDETYHHERGAWESLDADQRAQLADAYAAMAWLLGAS